VYVILQKLVPLPEHYFVVLFCSILMTV